MNFVNRMSLAALLIAATNSSVAAQGTVTGGVLNARTGGDLVSIQIYLPVLGLGALTNQSGRFLIINVPAGNHLIVAEGLGYRSMSQQVTVGADQAVQVDFELEEAPLGLDEIVVTGTAGQARRREIGNSIEQLNVAADVIEPVGSIEGLLQGRVAGMAVQFGSGQVGEGAKIRLRGNVSAVLSNEPLVYIDGIRVQSQFYNNLSPTSLGQQWGAFVNPNPLNDLDPNDIERIEVIKGAAATTLYGTEAATGVIQIFTKRGTTGPPVWEIGTEQSIGFLNRFGSTVTLRGNPVDNFPRATSSTDGSPKYNYLDPWLRNPSWQQKYSTSVRGGSNQFTYFVAGSYQDDEDVFVVGGQEAYSIRGNVGVTLTSTLSIDWSTAFSGSATRNVGCGDNLHGICARQTYYTLLDEDPAFLDALVFDSEYTTDIARLVTGGTVRYQPTSEWSNRFTVGYDRASNRGRVLFPFQFPVQRNGMLSTTDNLYELLTLDFVSTYALNLGGDLAADVSAGFQRISRQVGIIEGSTENFPGPGLVTLSSGGISLARETQEEVVTGGAFGQVVLKYKDRFFLTGGARADGNSAFGEDFGIEVYPKVSAAYVISDEDFWPESLGQLKLRTAWGTAGRAPGAFDAVRTWSPNPWGTQSVFATRNLGNPDLGPETTTEVELGLESSLLDNRLSLDFTWYRQRTTEALMRVAAPPSVGSWETQLLNVGETENKGMELSVTGTLVQTRDVIWDLGVDVSTNHSEVLDLGGQPGFRGSGQTRIDEGHEIPAVRGLKILNPNEVAPAQTVEDFYFGPNHPTLMVSPRTTLQLPNGITVSVRGEYQGGHWIQDGATMWSLRVGSQEQPLCFDAYPLIDAGRTDELLAIERIWCDQTTHDRAAFIYPSDYFKLREVSVRMPIGFAVPGSSSATLTLSGRNLYRWTKEEFRNWDPEAHSFGGPDRLENWIWQVPNAPRTFTAAVRVVI